MCGNPVKQEVIQEPWHCKSETCSRGKNIFLSTRLLIDHYG